MIFLDSSIIILKNEFLIETHKGEWLIRKWKKITVMNFISKHKLNFSYFYPRIASEASKN